MILLFSFFWYLRTARALLFALYLWQLKEYHIKRFLAHFETAKGRRLLAHPFTAAKLSLLALWFFEAEIAALLVLLLYAGETFLFLSVARSKTLLLPVLTRKTFVLAVSLGLVQAGFLAGVLVFFFQYLVPALLAFDVLSLLIGSVVILLWQPYSVFERSRILKRAKEKRARMKNLKVVGITGSYGKTSTKEILAHILSKKFVTLKTPEHKNSEMGIAHTILYDLTDEHEVFVCEMGAYNRGGIKLLADIARPSIGVLTGINEQHTATFGSQENIIKAKYELIESLPANGTAFFNAKNSYCVELYAKTTIKKILYGKEARFRGEENILGAMAVAKELGMSGKEISHAVKEIEDTLPGAKIKKGKGGITVIEATYSANPDGVFAALEYLKTWPEKKIMVMPCLIELGKASKEVHRKIGEKIAEACDLAIITTADEFEALKKGAGEKGMQEHAIVLLENKEEIAEKIKSTTQPGDVVLLEGRGPLGPADL